jgi:hypothetical protein
VVNQSLAYIASANRQDELALKHIEISRGLGTGNRAAFGAYSTLKRLGKWDVVLETLETFNDDPAIYRSCILAEKDSSSTEQLLSQLSLYVENLAPDDILWALGQCFALMGQPERGARLILLDSDNDYAELTDFWDSNPQAGAMRQTQIFRETLKEWGLLDYYREYGWPDLCHPLDDDDFECDP